MYEMPRYFLFMNEENDMSEAKEISQVEISHLSVVNAQSTGTGQGLQKCTWKSKCKSKSLSM
jgi:hypothetical protein